MNAFVKCQCFHSNYLARKNSRIKLLTDVTCILSLTYQERPIFSAMKVKESSWNQNFLFKDIKKAKKGIKV